MSQDNSVVCVPTEGLRNLHIMADSNLNTSTLSRMSEINDQSTDHWVTELFPVTYTLEDPNGGSSDENDEKPKMSIFEQLAHKLSPLDKTALRNVYEKVWLMIYLQEKEKLRRQEQTQMPTSGQEKGSKCQHDTTDKTTLKDVTLQAERMGTIDDVLTSGVSNIDIHDAAIWSSEEISILRGVFRKAKDENHKLKAEIYTLKSDINKLNKKYRHAKAAAESKSEKLEVAVKANERFQIAVDNLKTELRKTEASIQFLHDQLQHERERGRQLAKDANHLKLDLDRERLFREKVERDLAEENANSKRTTELLKERLSSRHKVQIDKLNDIIKELQTDLESEKDSHHRSKRALDHLRTHFASTDLQVENSTAPGPVTQDQLTKWTY